MSPNAYPVGALPDFVCALWLPVLDPFQAVFAGWAQIFGSDTATPVVRYFFSWAPQMLEIDFGWKGPWRTSRARILVSRELDADETCIGTWAKQAVELRRPGWTHVRRECREELRGTISLAWFDRTDTGGCVPYNHRSNRSARLALD